MKRGGAYYSTVATQLLSAHYNDLNETHVVNVANQGAVELWPEDWVLEMPANICKQGIEPLPAEPLPAICYGLIAQVKTFELYTVEAAVHGDRQAAFKAQLRCSRIHSRLLDGSSPGQVALSRTARMG